MSAIRIRTRKCLDCGKELTMTEDHYYEYRCEGCEGAWQARLESWRMGKPDAQLDSLFGNRS